MAKSRKAKPAKRSKAKDQESAQAELPMPSDRDLKHYISALAVADERVKKEQKSRTKIYEAAKAVGISKVALDRGRSLAARNPIEAKNELMQTALVLQEMGSPIGFEVFEARHGDPVSQAKVHGFADGKAAKDKDASRHGYIKGSPAARAYDDSYDAGQAENMAGIKKAGKEVAGATAH